MNPSNLNPGDSVQVELQLNGGGTGSLINPVMADLLPPELEFDYWATLNKGSFTNAPSPNMEVINNFAGTGRQMVRFSWATDAPTQSVQFNGAVGTTNPFSFTTAGATSLKVGFYAKVTAATPAGTYSNTAQLTSSDTSTWITCDGQTSRTAGMDVSDWDSDGNTTEQACSTRAPFSVLSAAVIDAQKWIKGHATLPNIDDPASNPAIPDQFCPNDDGYTRFPCVAQTLPGSSFNYKLKLINSGNRPMTDYVLYDVLPFVGDTGVSEVLSTTNRASQWQPVLDGAVEPANAFAQGTAFVVEYSTSSNPCRPEVSSSENETGWQTSCVNDWTPTVTDWTQVRAFRIKVAFAAPDLWQPGAMLIFNVPMLAPIKSPTSTTAWNSLAHRATDATNQARLPAAEPRKAGISIPSSAAFTGYRLGNLVWFDVNNNGLAEDNEPGIRGVRVQLRDAVSDTLVASTATDASGKYVFTGLPAGDYYVLIPNNQASAPIPTALLGLSSSTNGEEASANDDGDNNDNGTQVIASGLRSSIITLGEGNGQQEPTNETHRYDNSDDDDNDSFADNWSNLTVDFGFYKPKAQFGDRVWLETDTDGLASTGTVTPIAGVVISATDGTNTYTTTTDANGYYSFTVDAGTYTVTYGSIPAVYGLVKPSSTPAGNIEIGNAGQYQQSGQPDQSHANGTSVTLAPAEANWHVDFALTPSVATFGNFVWVESDTDGIAATGTITPVVGKVITATDQNGVVYTQTTNSQGYYTFTVPVGIYTVTYGAAPSGTVASATPNISTANGTTQGSDQQSRPNSTVVTLVAGDVIPTIDFGFTVPPAPKATFGNFVWIESDTDGIAATGTITPVVGKIITATDQNGVVYTQTTNSQGYYTFTVPVGIYTVTYGAAPSGTVASATPNISTANGTTQGSDQQSRPNSTVVTLVAGDVIPTIDFGFTVPPAPKATFGNFVWIESDTDGIAATGTITPVVGKIITATDQNGVVYTQTTNSQGYYTFTVPVGIYTVTYGAAPSGTVASATPNTNTANGAAQGSDQQSRPNSTVVTLVAGDVIPTIDFGFTVPPAPKATFGNFVWIESDTDGIAATGTITPVVGKIITATDQNGVVYTQTTNSQGYYTFTVPVGIYTVTYGAAPSGTVASATPNTNTANGTTQGSDQQSRPNSTVVTLVAGDVIPTIDFGFTVPPAPKATFGNFVWIESDTDGIAATGTITPVVGKIITATDQNGVVYTQTTNSQGYYTFTVPVGIYTVTYGAAPSGTVASATPNTNTANGAAQGSDQQSRPNSTVVTLVAGDVIPTIDFGFYQTASLGDFVWQDINHNGVQDAGEPGVAGVTVTLETPTTTLSTHTNASGYYSFTNLVPNVPYTVSFSAPNGYTFTLPNIGSDATDSDANTISGQTPSVTLKPGEFNSTIDAGLWQSMALGNYVWIDTNNNGLNDEPASNGVDGVSVNLYLDNGDGVLGAGDTLISSTTTANTGYYLFTNLVSGTYLMQIPSSNFEAGAPLFNHSSSTGNGMAVTNNNTDNDDDGEPQGAANNIVSRPITLTPNQEPDNTPNPNGNSNLSVDFGFFPYASLGDRVWFDVNANGIQDTNEMTGVAGVPVVLYSALTHQPIATTTTDANGLYHFTQLIPGDYFVQFDLPTGWTRSPQDSNGNTDEAVDSDADVSTGRTAVTTLVAGENDLTWDAGLYYTASVGDRMWEDLNHNGLQDAGEPGVGGVIVTLFANGQPISATTTDANGFYQFNDLTPSVPYSVSFVLPAGYQFTTPDVNNNGSDAADSDVDVNGSTQVVILAPNEHNPTLDAGIWRPAGIGDFVWLDNDRDGVQGSNEPGVPNVSVTLYRNGVAISTTTTNAQGYYSFTGLIPDAYSLTFGLPEGYGRTQQDALGNSNDAADSDTNVSTGATVTTTLVSGEYDSTWDMGVYQLASLGDYVWIDANRNGQQDAGETPVPNVRVVLHDANGTAILTTTTDSNGFYHFINLQPGSYSVQFDVSTLPANYVPTTQGPTGAKDSTDSDADTNGQTELTTLVAGENDLSWDMGIYLPTASLGDFVWVDTNHDGQQQTGEPALPGVVVTLYINGSPISTTTTDSNGTYNFTNLLPGVAYTLQFGLPSGFAWTQPLTGSPVTDSNVNGDGQTSPVTLLPDEFNSTIDAGVVSVIALGKTGVGSGLNGSIGSDNLITYTLTITNNSKLPVSGLVISDALPSNTEYAGKASVAPNGTTPLLWNLDTLQAGEVRTISFVVEVKNDATGVQNIAYVLELVPNTDSKLVLGRATATTPRGPTAVNLVSFIANPAANGVQVTWQTGAEINTFGFAVYRAESADRATAVLVTEQTIAAHGVGDYSFNDTRAKAGVAYRYWLVEAETDGAINEYGPTTVVLATETNGVVNAIVNGTQNNSNPTWTPSVVAVAGGLPVAGAPVAQVEVVKAAVAAQPNMTTAQNVVAVAATAVAAVNQANPAVPAAAPAAAPAAVEGIAAQPETAHVADAPAVAAPAVAAPVSSNQAVVAQPVQSVANEVVAGASPAANARTNASTVTQPNVQVANARMTPAMQQPVQAAKSAAQPSAQPQVLKLSPVMLAMGIAGTFVVFALLGIVGIGWVISRKRRL